MKEIFFEYNKKMLQFHRKSCIIFVMKNVPGDFRGLMNSRLRSEFDVRRII